jgi:hypothetical protein
MLRVYAIAAMLALVLPNLATAEEPHRGPPGKPAVAGRPPGPAVGRPGPALRPGPPVVGRPGGPPVVGRPGGPVVGVRPVGPGPGPGRQFSYHGRFFNPVHLAPYSYPAGYGYRRWAVGLALPAIFLTSAYFYADYANLGLESPPPGFQWVRYGPDLLLVDQSTGMISDTVYGAFN